MKLWDICLIVKCFYYLEIKIEIIDRFTNTTPIINNGSIKNITGTNVAYVMPHIIVIKNNKYLIFDECDVFI